MAFDPRPQVSMTVEQSPWQTFFDALPNTVLSFIQLQNQLEYQRQEKEKDREFQLTKMHQTDMINTKNVLQKAVINSTNNANKIGMTLDTQISDLYKRSPAHATSNFSNMKDDYLGYLTDETEYFSNLLDEIHGETKLFNAGKQSAFDIDTNYNSLIDPKELDVWRQSDVAEEMFGGEVPESFISGAKNYLLDPKIRPIQEKKRQAHKTGELLDLLSNPKHFPQLVGNQYIQAAQMAYFQDPTSKNVGDNIDKAFTETPDAGDAFKDQIETTDITFRNFMEGLESHRAGVQDAFFKGLPIQGTEDYKTKSLTDPNFITSFRRDLGTNFATWFSGKTREGENYSSAPASWIEDRFEAAGGWKDIDNSVPMVMSDPRWQELISNPEKLEDAFDWTGAGLFNFKNEAEEEAANNFFLKSVELYDLVDTIEGMGMGYSPEFLKTLGAETGAPEAPETLPQGTVPADSSQVQVPVDSSQAAIPAGYSDQSDFIAQHAYKEEEPPEVTLRKSYIDPSAPPSLAANIGNALDLLQNESQVNQLAQAIANSQIIKKEFRAANQDIDLADIISQWQAEGEPDVGDWLLTSFPNIEPEFIR